MRAIFIFLLYTLLLFTKELNIAFGYDKPPYTFSKNSTVGIEPDLVKAILEPLGYKINIIQMNKFYLENILYEKNNYDAAVSISKRENDGLCYSDNFTYYENYAITRKKDHIKIDSIDDLKNVDFVSWNGSYNDLGEHFYKLFNPQDGLYKNRYHQNPSQMEDVKMFFDKKVDAILIDKNIFKWYKTYFQIDDEFEFHKIFPKKKWYSVAFRDKKLCKEFNSGLKKIKEDGTYNKIINYYLSHNMVTIIKFVDVLSEVIAPYLYRLDKATAKDLLKTFIKSSDILSIKIIDNKLNRVFLKVSKNGYKVPSKFMKRAIFYKSETGLIKLGEVEVEYKRDFSNKRTLPFIEDFYSVANADTEKIYNIYKQNRVIIAKKVPLTDEEKAYLKKIKFINVHNEKSWAPYNFIENGEPKGFSIDYMKLLGRKLNIKINFVSGYTWNEFLELIKNDRIDVIANIMNTPERRAYINFTRPYIFTKKAIFSNQPNLKHFSDLEGKTVAVPKGFYIEEFLRSHYPKIKIKTYKNVLGCIVAVLNKKADALVESYNVVNYLLQKNNLSIKYMTISEDKELSSSLCLGVTKGKPLLRNILDKAIKSVTKEELKELKDKWADVKERQVTEFSDEEAKYLKKIKRINVCVNPNWAPIEYRDNNRPLGISIDVLDIVAGKLDKEINYIDTKSLSESIEYLENGECDLIPSLVYTAHRSKKIWFTKPYITYKLAIITRDDSPVITDMDELTGKVMSRKRGSALVELMKEKYPLIKIKEVDSYEDAFDDVKNKRAYFTVAALPILSYYKHKYGLDDLKVAGYLDMQYPISMAITKQNYLLYGIIEKTLASIPKNTFKIINERWTTFKVIEKIDYKLILEIVFIFLLIISIILIAYFKQKKLHDKINELNRTLESRVQEEIAKNREKEKMILYQDRLAKMGEIISMIAHQWRQPLNNLSIIIQMLTFKYKKGQLNDEVMEKFKSDSTKQITMMSKTIDDFKDFFKPEKDKQSFELKELILDMVDLLKPILKRSKIDLKIDMDDDIFINGYRNEFGQSIFNIINNAKDALNENRDENKKIEIFAKEIKDKIILTIKDNGGGIDEEIKDKIFEPYFSTKENKNGTGLGLYMSKIIIEDYMKGKISVYNDNEGAVFEIELPRG